MYTYTYMPIRQQKPMYIYMFIHKHSVYANRNVSIYIPIDI